MNLSPWQLKVYTGDDKASLRATVTRLPAVSIDKKTNAPYTFNLSIPLSDYKAANLGRGMYFELGRSRSGPKTLWENGYIQNIVKSTALPGTMTLQCVSPLWFLNKFRTLGNYNAGPGIGYADVVDLFNGVGSPVTAPEHQGILPPGWTTRWIDFVNTPASSPAGLGGVVRGGWDTATASVDWQANHYNFLYREHPIVSSTIVSVNWGATQITVTTGTGSSFHVGSVLIDGPKTGTITAIAGDVLTISGWGTAPSAGDVVSQVNYAYSGQIDMGPLGDASSLAIWGGAPLLADMQTNHGYVSATGRADLETAQSLGYAVITNAQHQIDYANVHNIVWIVGRSGHSIHNLAGGPPLDAGGSPQNGWSLLTLTHAGTSRPYYVKTATNYATYDGHVYSFVAAQGQTADATHSAWDYGVIDITSANLYGPCEYTLEELKIKDARTLLAAGLGCLNTWGQPVESFTFEVAHPLTSASGNPNRAAPGQSVTVHYSGQMPSIERDANGQWGPSGSGVYTYIDYPGTADALAVAKLKRVIEYTEDFSGGTFKQTLVLGTSKSKRPNGVNGHLAKLLMLHRHEKARVHSFHKYEWKGTPLLCSTSPLAYEREKLGQLIMNPGSIAVTDIPHSQFFTDGHKVSFTVAVTDGTQYLDFWINKPLDNDTLLTPNPTPGGGPTRTYGALRLAFTDSPNSGTNSATSCGFYSTSDGSTWVQRGTVFRIPALDSSRRLTKGTYRVTIVWHGGRFEAYIWAQDSALPAGINTSHFMCAFPDKNPQIVSSQWGALGWMLHQGSPAAILTDLHAHIHHPQKPPAGSVNIAEVSNNHPTGHRRRVASLGGGGYSISHEVPN